MMLASSSNTVGNAVVLSSGYALVEQQSANHDADLSLVLGWQLDGTSSLGDCHLLICLSATQL